MSSKKWEDLEIPTGPYSIKKKDNDYLIFLKDIRVGMVEVESSFPDTLDNLFIQSYATRVNPGNGHSSFLVLSNVNFMAVTNEVYLLARAFFWVPSLTQVMEDLGENKV